MRALSFDMFQGYLFSRPLPAADAAEYLRRNAPAGDVTTRTDRELILVVDDDEGMRRSLERMLAKRGSAVRVAGDAEEALAVRDSTGGHLDLVLADVMLPLSAGVAKVTGLRGLLAKPFSETQLLTAVGEALS